LIGEVIDAEGFGCSELNFFVGFSAVEEGCIGSDVNLLRLIRLEPLD